MPHPADLTPGLVAKLLTEAKRGLPIAIVARRCRVRPATLAAWIAAGDRDDATEDQIRFTRDYTEAHASFIADQHEVVATSLMMGKEAPNATARLALLERLAPNEYARRAPAAEVGPAPSEVPAQVAKLTQEQRAALKAALAEQREERTPAPTTPTVRRL